MSSQFTKQLEYGGWGMGLGAGIAMLIGFSLGGWVTSGTAAEMSSKAVLETRSEICVAQFMNAPDHAAQVKAFQETDSWKRRELVENGGWDKMPGETDPSSYVANACVDGIEMRINK